MSKRCRISEIYDEVDLAARLLQIGINPSPEFKLQKRRKPEIGEALLSALEDAIGSRSKIAAEQDKLRELLAEETDPERQAGRQYQIDLVAWQLNRAADFAEKRLKHLQTIRTSDDVDHELERCRRDKHHWYDMYAWGFDPRHDSPLNIVPFSLFEFQKRYVDWLDYIVFRTRQSGVVPKSRDMGATEGA
ncbi:MAG: hypothetical protein AAB288_08235, partial [Acidobacteriota bacterium]